MQARDVVIVPYQDGPYLVRGPVELRDQNGREIALARRTIALCRCGKSRMRPFCDGTHRLVRFQAPSAPENARPVLPPPDPPVRTNGTVRMQTDSRFASADLEVIRDALEVLIAIAQEGDRDMSELVQKLAAVVTSLENAQGLA